MTTRSSLVAVPYLSEIRADIAQLEADVAAIEAEIVLIQNSITNIEGDVSTLQSQVNNMQIQITALQNLTALHTQQINAIGLQTTANVTFTVDDFRWGDPDWDALPTIPANNDFFNALATKQGSLVTIVSNGSIADGIQNFLRGITPAALDNVNGMDFTHNLPPDFLPITGIAGCAVARFRVYPSTPNPLILTYLDATFAIRNNGTATFYLNRGLSDGSNLGYLEPEQGLSITYSVPFTLP